MATRAELEQFNRAQGVVVRQAMRDLTAFWTALDLTDLVAARQALEDFFPDLIHEYGLAAATLAADRFDDLRSESSARRAFRAVTAEPVQAVQANARLRWAITPGFGGNLSQALSNLLLITDEYVKQPARDTIAISSELDPSGAGWARVPSGPKTCAFCLMLASRGAVYRSRETAAATASGRRYHGDCDCVPTPVWDETDYPEDYDPAALTDAYAKARTTAGSGDPKAILSALRAQEGIN